MKSTCVELRLVPRRRPTSFSSQQSHYLLKSRQFQKPKRKSQVGKREIFSPHSRFTSSECVYIYVLAILHLGLTSISLNGQNTTKKEQDPKIQTLLSTMKTSTPLLLTALLLITVSTLAAPHPIPNQHLQANPATCSLISTLQVYILDLTTHPTESDLYMAEAQALTVDERLDCPTKNGILIGGEPASVSCQKNQEVKDAINELKYASPEDKRLRVQGLDAACVELGGMIGCPST